MHFLTNSQLTFLTDIKIYVRECVMLEISIMIILSVMINNFFATFSSFL